jgi:hypothetical protein
MAKDRLKQGAQKADVESEQERKKRNTNKQSNDSKMARFCKKQVEIARAKDCDVLFVFHTYIDSL